MCMSHDLQIVPNKSLNDDVKNLLDKKELMKTIVTRNCE